MRKVLWILAVGLVLAGCRSNPTFYVSVEAKLCCGVDKYTLTVNGKDIGPLPADRMYGFEAPATPGQEHPLAMMPKMQAKVLTVCGWHDVRVELEPPSRAEIEQAKGPVNARASIDFYLPERHEVSVFVDNRGGAEAQLSLGDNKQTIAAGAAEEIKLVYFEQCEAAKIMRLNGEVIANLPSGSSPAYLLDTSGSRCYTFRMKEYVVSSLFASAQPKPEYVSSQKAHLLTSRPVDYFQKAAPDSIIITSEGNGFSARRLSVMDTRCK